MHKTTLKTICIALLLLASTASYLFLNHQLEGTLSTTNETTERLLESSPDDDKVLEEKPSSVLSDAAIIIKLIEKSKKIIPSS